jgi:hypothetical protein
MLVVVLNCCVIDTNDTPRRSKTSTSLAKSESAAAVAAIAINQEVATRLRVILQRCGLGADKAPEPMTSSNVVPFRPYGKAFHTGGQSGRDPYSIGGES